MVKYAVSCHDLADMDDKEVGRRFGRRLKELRRRGGLTQERLAELANISVKHIQRLESKEPCGVRLVTLFRIAKAFSITCSKLLNF